MIQNRSLKDITLKPKLLEDKLTYIENVHSPTSKEFRFNIDSALKYISKVDKNDRQKDKDKVLNLSARSHKKLIFSSSNSSFADLNWKSPSNAHVNQTDRCLKEKNWDNVQVSNFNISGDKSNYASTKHDLSNYSSTKHEKN
jgi:hypothetical protein